jgi:hypothetical protein
VRLEVSREYFDKYIKPLNEYVPVVPTELLFNIDEKASATGDNAMPNAVWYRQKPRW